MGATARQPELVVKPNVKSTPSSPNSRTLATSSSGFAWESLYSTASGRPSTPPLELITSTARSAPCLPRSPVLACGPENGRTPPSTIGSPVGAAASPSVLSLEPAVVLAPSVVSVDPALVSVDSSVVSVSPALLSSSLSPQAAATSPRAAATARTLMTLRPTFLECIRPPWRAICSGRRPSYMWRPSRGQIVAPWHGTS